MSRKRILVTGGTGMLGSYLLRYLVQQGKTDIMALKRPGSPMHLVESVKDEVQWIEGDILDVPLLAEIMAGIDEVYHAAALVSYDKRARQMMWKVNVEGTANVVNLALETGIKKLLHVSSIAAIGLPKGGGTLDERSKWIRGPYTSDYAISKFLAEQEVWRGMAEGLDMVIVNPSVIIGSGYWDRGSCLLFEKVWKDQKIYPSGSTGFVDVRDVARLMIRLMNSTQSAERFLANGENLSYLSFFTQVASVLKKRPPSVEATPWINALAWRKEWLRTRLLGGQPIITRERAIHTANHYHYSNDKSISTLDFDYTPIGQSIRDTGLQFVEAKARQIEFSTLPLL